MGNCIYYFNSSSNASAYVAGDTSVSNVTNNSPVVLPLDDPSLSSLNISGNYNVWENVVDNKIYYPGDTVSGTPIIYLYPSYLIPNCFNHDTLILCYNMDTKEEIYIPVQNLTKNTYVKTYFSGYRKVDKVVHGVCKNGSGHWQNDMYVLNEHPNLIQPLIVTGGHSILVDIFSSNCLTKNKRPVMIDGKYLLLAGKTSLFAKINDQENYRHYHFTLQSDNGNDRFGVYANGILTEIPSNNYLKNNKVKYLIS